MKYWLLLLHPQYSETQDAKWKSPQRLCPDVSVAVKDKDKYFTLFHTIISYSGIKYFNKSGFVLLCCNYKNECWLYFIWNCHVLFFPSFGEKNQWICSVLWTQTNDRTHDFFQVPKLGVQPVHTLKKHIISISPAMSPITVTFNLLFFFHCCCLNCLELRDPFTP